MTGEPIYGQMDESIEDMAVRYNPMTEERVYKNEIAVKQWKEERKTVFLIPAGIAVTIALLVSMVKSVFVSAFEITYTAFITPRGVQKAYFFAC